MLVVHTRTFIQSSCVILLLFVAGCSFILPNSQSSVSDDPNVPTDEYRITAEVRGTQDETDDPNLLDGEAGQSAQPAPRPRRSFPSEPPQSPSIVDVGTIQPESSIEIFPEYFGLDGTVVLLDGLTVSPDLVTGGWPSLIVRIEISVSPGFHTLEIWYPDRIFLIAQVNFEI